MRYFPVCLHVVDVINSIALTQQRRGEEGYLNNPMTTVTQTEAVDRGMKDSSGKKRDENKAPVCTQHQSWGEGASVGGREGGFKW